LIQEMKLKNELECLRCDNGLKNNGKKLSKYQQYFGSFARIMTRENMSFYKYPPLPEYELAKLKLSVSRVLFCVIFGQSDKGK